MLLQRAPSDELGYGLPRWPSHWRAQRPPPDPRAIAAGTPLLDLVGSVDLSCPQPRAGDEQRPGRRGGADVRRRRAAQARSGHEPLAPPCWHARSPSGLSAAFPTAYPPRSSGWPSICGVHTSVYRSGRSTVRMSAPRSKSCVATQPHGHHPVLRTLGVTRGNGAIGSVVVLDPEIEGLGKAQPRAVEQAGDAVELGEQRRHLHGPQHDRVVLRAPGTHDPRDLPERAVQGDQGVESLVLGRGRDRVLDGVVAQETRDLGLAELARVALAPEQDEAFHPLHVALLGVVAIAAPRAPSRETATPAPHRLAYLRCPSLPAQPPAARQIEHPAPRWPYPRPGAICPPPAGPHGVGDQPTKATNTGKTGSCGLQEGARRLEASGSWNHIRPTVRLLRS